MSKICSAVESLLGETQVVGSEVLAKAMEKNRQKKSEKVSDLLVGILAEMDLTIQAKVSELRRIRQKEKKVKKELTDIVRKVEYAKETGDMAVLRGFSYNLVDLANVLGINLSNEVCEVPKDWEPKSEVVAE